LKTIVIEIGEREEDMVAGVVQEIEILLDVEGESLTSAWNRDFRDEVGSYALLT